MTPLRKPVVLAVVAVGVAVGVAVASGATDIGGRLASGRPAWILLGAGFELASALGFVVAFHLFFSRWLPQGTSLRTGLTVLAATILIPAGGLLAVGLGARALRRGGTSAAPTRSRAIAFLLITNTPNLIALVVFGLALGTGLLDGPRSPVLTIFPAAIALGAIVLTALLPALSHRRLAPVSLGLTRRVLSSSTAQLETGVLEARSVLRGRSWKLLGAGAYYAADNAVLWAMFKAFGHSDPPLATFAMAYLIGSTAASLPVPGGVGVVEGGMIGALVIYGAPAACATIAVLAYRGVSTGLPLALGGAGLVTLCRPARWRPRSVAHG